MLLELVLFFTLAAAITTVAVMVPGLVRAGAWASIPLGLAIFIVAGGLTGLIMNDPVAVTILPLFGVGAVIETRRHLPKWSMLAAQVLSTLVVASAAYLVYAGARAGSAAPAEPARRDRRGCTTETSRARRRAPTSRRAVLPPDPASRRSSCVAETHQPRRTVARRTPRPGTTASSEPYPRPRPGRCR